MPDIARLDSNGVIIAVETVSEADWVTDVKRLSVQLPPGHDMRGRLRAYRFNYLAGSFEPVVNLGMAAEHGVAFGEALAEAIVLLSEKTQTNLPTHVHRALGRKKK